MNQYFVAWWNLENLFSTETDPTRPGWLQRRLAQELAGWDQQVLDTKIGQLASVIQRLNEGAGPDILGVCEVENETVLQSLAAALQIPGRSYRVVHHDTSDGRGIDVAFIYDENRFDTKPDEIFHHVILKRVATRDLVQVNFYTKPHGNVLICIGNHWPSRLGGALESEPYRMLAGETLSYWITRIHEIFAERAVAAGDVAEESKAVPPPVLVMGDFNDEPFDRSLSHYALGERADRMVKSRRAQKPYLWNLMWPLMGSGHATHMYDGDPSVLDQFLVNRGLLDRDSPFGLEYTSVSGSQTPYVGIVRFPEMILPSGTNKGGPRRFSRPAKNDYDPTGYSDHFPIAIKLVERG